MPRARRPGPSGQSTSSSREPRERGTTSRRAELVMVVDGIRYVLHTLRVSSRATEQEIGLSGAQLFVLQQLARGPATSLNELAARTLTHQSSVSVVVSRLVKAGLIARQASKEDARRVLLDLTPAGRAIVARAPESAQSRLITVLRRLPAKRLSELARAMKLLVVELSSDQEARQVDRRKTPRDTNSGRRLA
jgi:DNA-binding MarR family transcriptional regulator